VFRPTGGPPLTIFLFIFQASILCNYSFFVCLQTVFHTLRTGIGRARMIAKPCIPKFPRYG
jgi:hypothetical protein